MDIKRPWIWALLLGLIVGTAAGIGLSPWLLAPSVAEGSAFLQSFSFQEAAAKAGGATWEIVEDRTYSPFPTQGRPARIARRIVARATVSEEEQHTFAEEFQGAVEAALTSYGGVVKGEFDCHRAESRVVNGTSVSSLSDLPRRYYAIGNTHGVADVWVVAEEGRVTVIVSLIE